MYTVESLTYKPNSWSPEQTMNNYVMNPAANGYRLPTSAEWEYAAKGGEEGVKNLFVYAGSNNWDDVAWIKDNSPLTEGGSAALHEVATKQSNQLGIYDMSGNIEEWVYDWNVSYGSSYEYPTQLTEDFAGPAANESGYNKVMRGGVYSSAQTNAKLYSTRPQSPTEDDYYQSRGFRVVRNAQ